MTTDDPLMTTHNSTMDVMQDACINQYFIVMGISTACLSTSLGSLFGASRILQAIARDNIYPCLRPFAYGSRTGDEPRVAIVLCWAVAQIGLMLGDLSAVAPILTNFFLITYALTNLSAFFLAISKVPPSWPLSATDWH
jgi:amino acid transporter